MQNLIAALGFKITRPWEGAVHIETVDPKTGKTTNVKPCLLPEITKMWDLLTVVYEDESAPQTDGE